MTKHKVYFRADGNEKIGLGHIYRCLAIAEHISSYFTISFIVQSPTSFIKNELTAKRYELIELPFNSDYKKEAQEVVSLIPSYSIIVLDGYNLLSEIQRIYKEANFKVVMIDDVCQGYYYADVIINHAVGVNAQNYTSDFNTRFYLGTNYALLRAPFVNAAKQTRQLSQIKNLFVNLGGADPENYTKEVIESALVLGSIEKIMLVLGSSYKHMTSLEKYRGNDIVSFYSNLSGDELCELMKLSDAAICSASTISYEYCSVGGMLFIIKTADNQKYLYNFLIDEQLAYSIDELERINELDINHLLLNQNKYFDGKSDLRLLSIFQNLLQEEKLEVRAINKSDMLTLFNWSNDPEVRRNSINKNPIQIESHEKWFYGKLESEDAAYYVLSLNSKPVGLVRYDNYQDYWLISFLVDKEYRGKGFGEIILHKSLQQFVLDKQVKQIKAQVWDGNIASHAIFIKLGFELDGFEVINGVRYTNYYKRNSLG